MNDKPRLVMGRVVQLTPSRPLKVEPIGLRRPCAVNNCRRPAAGLFEWDKDVLVELCQTHADHLDLHAVDG